MSRVQVQQSAPQRGAGRVQQLHPCNPPRRRGRSRSDFNSAINLNLSGLLSTFNKLLLNCISIRIFHNNRLLQDRSALLRDIAVAARSAQCRREREGSRGEWVWEVACYTGIVVLLRDARCSRQRVEMYCCIGHLFVLTRKYALVVL